MVVMETVVRDAGNSTYSITFGGESLYGVSYAQLEGIYGTMKVFIEREGDAAGCRSDSYGEYPIEINKLITRYADSDHFFVDYGLSTFECDAQCLCAGQLRRVAMMILAFLARFEEKEVPDVGSGGATGQENALFHIGEDSRKPEMTAQPLVTKSVSQCDDEPAQITYFVGVNELELPELSFCEFTMLYETLRSFLKRGG